MPDRAAPRPMPRLAVTPSAPQRLDPLSARAWAEAAVGFWRSAQASGLIAASQTLDVLDLCPGRGEAPWLMMQALRRSLRGAPELQSRLRYLVAAPRRDWLASFRSQEEFQPWLQDASLVPVLWDPQRGDPCLLTPHKRLPWQPGNPVVVLAHDLWARLEQRLLAVHYGALLEADIAELARVQPPEQEAGLWRPAREQDLPEGLAQRVRDCLARFNSVPMPLPLGAVRLAERIAGLAPRGYLMLAAAEGLATESQVRLQTFPGLVERHRKGQALPVNFYLLANYFADAGAAAAQFGRSPGSVTQAVVGALPQPQGLLAAAAERLSESECGDATGLAALARAAAGRARLDGDAILALLRRAEFDPEVFTACCGAIMESLKPEATVGRARWRQALQQVWLRHLPLAGARPLHRMLAPALMRAGAWGASRAMLLRGLDVHGDDALDLAHVAWCEFRTGRLHEARKWIRRALAMPERHATVDEVATKIEASLLRLRGGWLELLVSPALPICLEPLDAWHAEALLLQYRDPQIAVMTGLPALPDIDAVRKWIGEHLADENRRAYAVMHAEHGFVGYACMSIAGTIAYFCFWIGADHQGSGYAAEVARLTCEHAKRQGMRHIYTSAYDDNARSLRSLQRVGFRPLPIRALPPDNDRTFLFLQGVGAEVDDPCADLVAYYRDEKLPLKFPESEASEDEQQAPTETARH
jgi:RimJ/RimL family protein N-acetyltransferase